MVRGHADTMSCALLGAAKAGASLVIESLPFRSGYSTDIDGVLKFSPARITVSRDGGKSGGQESSKRKQDDDQIPLLHFKLAESHVTFRTIHTAHE